jgi:hypothetical protein
MLHPIKRDPAIIGLNHSAAAVIIPEWLKVAEGAPFISDVGPVALASWPGIGVKELILPVKIARAS